MIYVDFMSYIMSTGKNTEQLNKYVFYHYILAQKVFTLVK